MNKAEKANANGDLANGNGQHLDTSRRAKRADRSDHMIRHSRDKIPKKPGARGKVDRGGRA